MNLLIKKTSSPEELEQCLHIRKKVFVEGQNVPIDEEIDGKDKDSEHYLLLIDNEPTGTARVRFLEHYAKIERVAILAGNQGRGLGLKLMQKIVSDLKEQSQVNTAKLGAQTYAIPFYEKLGFTVCSEEYMDANIPHKDMELNVKSGHKPVVQP